jgi:NADH-quinone oxidoreductase subunit J
MGNLIIFIPLALVAILAAIFMVRSHNAVHSALFLVLNFVTIAVMYLILNAPFIAMVQITVYAGAIMVLFLFVIMLLGAERLQGVSGDNRLQWGMALLLGVVLLGSFLFTLVQDDVSSAGVSGVLDSSPTNLGIRLFETYVVPFELTGILLLVAMIGVVVLGYGKKRGEDA